MTWVAASILSAVVMGFYELATKHAVRGNAVLPALFLSTLCSATLWGALLATEVMAPGALPAGLVTTPLSGLQHLQLLLKSTIVTGSWVCSYFAVKHLPLSLASPIRATGPLWTLVGALVVLAERPTTLELVGIATTLLAFLGLSLAGAREGVQFHRNKWVGYLVAGTLLGAVSSLYDKYLLDRAGFDVPTVQAWFSIYLAVLFLPLAVGWKRRWWPRQEFHWRWSLPLMAASLLVADYAYFAALRDPESLVSAVASIRRGSTLVAFIGGLWWLGEAGGWRKWAALAGILGGIVLTILG